MLRFGKLRQTIQEANERGGTLIVKDKETAERLRRLGAERVLVTGRNLLGRNPHAH